MKTYQIHIQGQVQGVGFRPFVYQLAQHYGLAGQVSNRTDGVRILVNGERSVIKSFLEDIHHNHPKVARITAYSLEEVAQQSFDEFGIVHSQRSEHTNVLLTPDLGLCPTCRAELSDRDHRRYQYAFTNCTHCGPRYSIIMSLPYDRATTAMAPFELCEACSEEYENPLDRRYYAQANSCLNCAITLSLYDEEQQLLSDDQVEILKVVAERINQGAIGAIKGVGGYLLVCDAANAQAIRTLRHRKHRPTKPLAVMYPSLDQLTQDTLVDPKTRELLTGIVAPIVLLPLTDQLKKRIVYQEIAPNLMQVGVMLPYAPLFAVLMNYLGRPIVATSGNISGSPIIYTEEAAQQQLSALVDFRMDYNREIVVSQDDSVVRFSPDSRQRIVLRRSRGLAPTLVLTEQGSSNQCLLAMGADLKSTFAYTHGGNQYVSQYLGDLGSFDAQQSYQQVLNHLLGMFGSQPEAIIADQHPGYFSAQLGEELAEKWAVPLYKAQHHEAHFAAVLGENQLINTQEPILGVVWDGTGLGTDGQIWGGEFFIYHNYHFRRVNHFDYFPQLMGDKMAQEPRLSALSLALGNKVLEKILREKFTSVEWRHYTKQLQQANGLQTSSVGRLFDAVASLLGLIDKASYEGEAALRLETSAADYIQQYGYDHLRSYAITTSKSVPTQKIIGAVASDQAKSSVGLVAARFHLTLAHIILDVADKLDVKRVAFSGGGFQNALLIDLIQAQMANDFTLHFHQELSPNDENISFGQLVHYRLQRRAKQFRIKKPESVSAV